MGKKDKKKAAAHKERVAQKVKTTRKIILMLADSLQAVEEGGKEQQKEGPRPRR
jgi:hypothetical protein